MNVRTQAECSDLIGRRVVTPKGDGVVCGVREPTGFAEDPFVELCVLLDSYASKNEQYDGTWMRETDATPVPRVTVARSLDRPLDFSMTFPITLRELTLVAFVAGVLRGHGHGDLSATLREMVDRITAG